MTRLQLLPYLGEPVKIKPSKLRGKSRFLVDRLGTLVEVRRTRCTIDFDDAGKWTVGIKQVQLEYQHESAPGQRYLFEGVAK